MATSRPKIALVANTAWNLHNFRTPLIELLVEQGFEVVCIAPKDGYEQYFSGLTNVRFVPLLHLYRKGLSIIDNLLALREIYTILKAEKPDCVILYTVKPVIFGALAAARLHLKSIAAIEGLGYTATAGQWFRYFIFTLYRWALKQTQHVVFLNHDDATEFINRKVLSAEKAIIIKGTGIDMEHFKAPISTPVHQTVFLFIGRLLSDKGIREFVGASEMMKTQAPNIRFQVLGKMDADNPTSIEEQELQQWIHAESIEYLGYTDDVRPFIEAATVVVLPSYREGMPRVILEGMAMGKPIITTNSVGCRDTVEEGVNGYIVSPENTTALYEAFLKFLSLSPEKQREMGENSRKKALSEFSNHQILPAYVALIKQTIGLQSTPNL